MSTQEQAVRGVVLDKIREMQGELGRLGGALAALEREVRAQPLAKPFDGGTAMRTVEGWVGSIIESYAVIEQCDRLGGAGISRLRRFVQQLAMSLHNWRLQRVFAPFDGPDGKHHPMRVTVDQPELPARTIKGHDDVRRVLSNRSGQPLTSPRMRDLANVQGDS